MRYKASETFWRNFNALPAHQKKSVREKWLKFKVDPFDPSLRSHKINRLTALHRSTVYGVWIEPDLRAVFKIDGDIVYTIDIGKHAVYG